MTESQLHYNVKRNQSQIGNLRVGMPQDFWGFMTSNPSQEELCKDEGTMTAPEDKTRDAARGHSQESSIHTYYKELNASHFWASRELAFSKPTDFHIATKCNSTDLFPNICENSLDRVNASQDSLWNWVILVSSVILETYLIKGRFCDTCSGDTGRGPCTADHAPSEHRGWATAL